uniref:Uncharacterized protein n=1 Tax=Setaria italica TaxID=4555 RepID=K3XTU8_SETIT
MNSHGTGALRRSSRRTRPPRPRDHLTAVRPPRLTARIRQDARVFRRSS